MNNTVRNTTTVLPLLPDNTHPSICSQCQGRCCKNGAGGWFPEDLPQPVTVELLLEMVTSKGYQFDYWEGNPTDNPQYNGTTAYYLRPQHTNSIGKVVDGSWGGQCHFLTDKGCPFTFNERPTQCKALIPDKSYHCNWDEIYSKQNIAIAWLPYNSIIEEVIDKVRS